MQLFRTSMLWLLVVSIATAPVMPAMAVKAPAPDAAHANHLVAMDAAHHESAAPGLADIAAAPTNDCTKHNACDGTCCGACAQCATAAVSFMSDTVPLFSVQTPVIPRLHARLGMTLPNRPPQTLL